MRKLAPGQVLSPGEPLVNYREFNQNGVPPGPRKLAQFPEALRVRGTPPLYAQESKGDEAVVQVRLFDPCGSATWYLLEWDGQNEAFGYVTGADTDEYSYVPLDELAAVKGHFGIGIEIDVHFLPTKLGKARTGKKPSDARGS